MYTQLSMYKQFYNPYSEQLVNEHKKYKEELMKTDLFNDINIMRYIRRVDVVDVPKMKLDLKITSELSE